MKNSIFTIKGQLFLDGEIRKTPIQDDYRPAFLCNGKLISGHIKLLNVKKLNPNEYGLVEVRFISNNFLNNIKIGDNLEFYEGPVLKVGILKVLEILD